MLNCRKIFILGNGKGWDTEQALPGHLSWKRKGPGQPVGFVRTADCPRLGIMKSALCCCLRLGQRWERLYCVVLLVLMVEMS